VGKIDSLYLSKIGKAFYLDLDVATDPTSSTVGFVPKGRHPTDERRPGRRGGAAMAGAVFFWGVGLGFGVAFCFGRQHGQHFSLKDFFGGDSRGHPSADLSSRGKRGGGDPWRDRVTRRGK